MSNQQKTLNVSSDLRAITFDAVGTLIVPHPSVGEIYAEELAMLGYAFSPALLENNFIKSFKKFKKDRPEVVLDQESWRIIVAGALGGMTPGNDFDRLFETLWNAFARPGRWSILPGVEETLHVLQNAGLRLFVLSNNDERLHDILHGLPIGTYFEEIFVSSELGYEKPSGRIFRLVEARIHVAAKNILHVGDSPLEDLQGALDAGWQAGLVGPHARPSCTGTAFRQAGSIRELFCKN